MACDCSNFARGRWSNGARTIFWAVKSVCKEGKIKFPGGFNSSDLDSIAIEEVIGSEDLDNLADTPRQAILFEKLAEVFEGTSIDGEDPDLIHARLSEFLRAPLANKITMCRVNYKLRWLPIGFAAGDLVRLKKFTVGGDVFGPYPAYSIPGAPARPVAQTHTADLCKSDADCDTITTPVLEFDLTTGGAGAAGKTVPLASISGFKTCWLRAAP